MAVATNTTPGTILLAGDLAGSSNANTPQLTPTGVVPGVYKGASVVVDAKGRILHARSLSNYDVGCATAEECGVVRVTQNHHIDLNDNKISIKKASKDDYGVVKLGAGFAKDCCEIFMDYTEATTEIKGVVTVPTSGNLLIDSAGNISVPIATTTVPGLSYAHPAGGLVYVDGTLSYSVPDASSSQLGFVKLGSNLTAPAGTLTVATASKTEKGIFRFNPTHFSFSSNTYSYNTIATNSYIGFIKLGSGVKVDENGILYRGAPSATTTTKGVVQVDVDGGLTVTGGTLSYSSPDATTATRGLVRVGSNITVASGVLSLPTATTSVKGVVQISASGFISVTNGVLDFGPKIVGLNSSNVYTSSQATALVTVASAASTTLDFSLSNVFQLNLGTNCVLNTPTNMVSGGKYVIIVKGDATTYRSLTFSSDWQFVDKDKKQGSNGPSISSAANATSVITVLAVDGKLIASIETDFA